jgi:hypothetical protein
MADAAAVEDLYETILGRASDAGGLAFWQSQLDSGVSLDTVKQGFYNSEEYQSSHPGGTATPTATDTSDTNTQGTTVLGQDVSKLRWDDLANDVQSDKLVQASQRDGYDMYSGTAYSKLLGANVQGYVDPYNNPNGTGKGDSYGVDANDVRSITNVNLKDQNGPEGYMTSLYRQDDGSVGVRYYKEQDTFLMDMVQFVAIAASMGSAITAAGASTTAAGTGVASGAAGATELSVADAALADAMTADFPGLTSFSPGSVGTGFQSIGTTGFQATGSLGFTASAATPGLGTLAPGFFAGETLGGLAALVPDALVAGTGYLGSLGPGYFSGETLGGLSPLVPKVMTPDVDHLGSLGEGYFKGETITPGTSGGTNWWEAPLKTVTDAVKDVGIKDVLSTLGTVGAITSVINGINGKNGTSITGPTINFPEIKPREPSSGPLSLPVSQRAGVRFGQTKSKRELRGKFSGTGLKI